LKKLYAGIDPGFSGAVAMYREDIDTWKVMNCPKTIPEISDIVMIMGEVIKNGNFDPVIAIERVWAQPNNAVRSAFKFGTNYGAWIAALSFADIPYIEVLPSKWQKEHKLPKDKPSRKRELRDKAAKLVNQVMDEQKIKVTLKNADAIMICSWLKNGGNNDESNGK
tara:strand:- start:4660 stop:5157 length:498 start_codon:yes stop_codon:yes gene_type:complete